MTIVALEYACELFEEALNDTEQTYLLFLFPRFLYCYSETNPGTRNTSVLYPESVVRNSGISNLRENIMFINDMWLKL